MTSSAPLPISLLRWVFAGLRAAGAADEDFARETGWKSTDDPDARVTCSAATTLIDGAIRVTNDPAFGLHAASAVQADDLGPALACCCGATPTSAELMHHAGRYLRLHGTLMGLQTEPAEAGTLVQLAFSPPSLDRASRAASEFVLGSLVVALREQSDQPGLVRAVHFRHAAPPFRSEYEALFECPVRFGATGYRLELAAEAATRKPRGEPRVPPWVAQRSGEAMERLPVVGPVSTTVRTYLAGRFPWGIPSMTQTAHGVSESVQSLYERLLPEGTAFARLREELLCELATSYLRERTLSTPEVAYLLGFVELDVFEQSFVRWTGMTVREYRGKQLAS